VDRPSHDIRPLTIPALVDLGPTRFGDAEAIVDGDIRVTFPQLRELMLDTAAAFVAAGIQRGDRVAIWAPNSVRWIVACIGLQAAGAVLVPLNTRFKATEADYILRRTRAKIVVAFGDFLGLSAVEMLDGLELPDLRRIVRIDGDGADGWDAFLAGATPEARAEAALRLAAVALDDVSDIMFTSGTTGNPKGAVTTHRQTVATAYLWAKATTLRQGDRFLVLWPFFHCAGYKAGWVVNLAMGATTLPEPTLDPERLLAKVEREKVTVLPGPPTLFQTLLTSPRPAHALDSVRVSVTGASSVAPALIDAIRDELGIPNVVTGYGLTETCGTVSMSSPTDSALVLTTTSGKPIEGIDVRIVDDAGQVLPQGEAGEILVRGMNVMQGYLDDPEATRAAFTEDGWLLTGDIGLIDAEGNLKITDRKKEMFIVGGFNCYPAEIEKILLTHPAILFAAVTGMPDERMGEVGVAHVVPKPGTTIDEAALIAWSRERMANFKVPRRVVVTDALPVTATGKVQKFKLTAPDA
jgi:acyl-CoA synthetase (AMP-forming)/AMP-acid ligase II